MCLEWQHVKTLPIQDASGDLELSKPSSSNWGRRIALNPKTVPMLVEATPETIHAAKYCKYIITVFENHPKCRIWIFQFWHFTPIFGPIKIVLFVNTV